MGDASMEYAGRIVKAVPKESLLILDLNGSKTAANGGWGYPVIAGNLHNFGGRINMLAI